MNDSFPKFLRWAIFLAWNTITIICLLGSAQNVVHVAPNWGELATAGVFALITMGIIYMTTAAQSNE
jgi:hypothetical protein